MKKMNIKRWLAGMMLPVTTLGAMAGVVTTDYMFETQNIVKAADVQYYATINGSVVSQYPIYIFSKTWDSSNTTPNYSLEKTISSVNDIGNGLSYSNESIDIGWDTWVFTNYGWSYQNDHSTVTSWSGVSLKKMVSDSTAPALETQVFLTDVDNPMSLEYILSQVKFVDEVDGDIEEVVVTDNYTPNMHTVGKWTVEVKGTDKAGNIGYGTIEVWVQDKTNPIISGPSTFTSNISAPLTEAGIRSQLSANDNVDGDISDDIQLVSDGFTGNENTPGTYTITYQVSDASTNTSVTYPVTVTVVDDIKPVFSIKEGYSANYTTSYKTEMALSTILNGIVVTDNVDGTLDPQIIENKYEGNSSIPGTYTITFRATDKAGNISDVFTVTIEVTDQIPPVFYASGLFIGVSSAQQLSHQELVDLLVYMQGEQNSNVGVSFVSTDGYNFDSVNAPGVYTLSYRLVAEDGTESELLTADIKVLGEEQVEENDTNVQVEQRVNKFWNKLGNVFKNIGEFFIKIFKSIAWVFTFGKVDPRWNEWY